MVVVVADPSLESGRRPGGLNAPDEAGGDQDAQGVVHRLERDGTDLGPGDLSYAVGCAMGPAGYGPQDGQSLGRDLNATLTKEVSRVDSHAKSLDQFID
jgi:hypothetical protein